MVTKRQGLIGALLAVYTMAEAGGLMTNTNQSASYHGNFAREASTELDAAYYNPAGLGFIEEGFSVGLSGQFAKQTRLIESSFDGFKYRDEEGATATRKYEGESIAPFVPSIQMAFKKNKWTFSLNMAVAGGGGKCTYADGLPSFESAVAALPGQLSALGINKYSMESELVGKQYTFGLQLGATYQITEKLAVYLGVRGVYAKNSYEGYIREIKANHPMTKQMMRVDELVKQLSSSEAMMAMIPDSYKAMMPMLVASTADRTIDCSQKGLGIAPIVGLDYNFGRVNIGAKYEFRTKLELKNETKSDAGEYAYKDGLKTRADIPALLTAGVNWQIIEPLKLNFGYRHFFDKKATIEKLVDEKTTINKADYAGKGTHDISASLEWQTCSLLRINVGAMRTIYAVEEEFQNDMTNYLSNWNYGLGLRFSPTEKMNIHVGGFYTAYDKDYTMNVNNRTDIYNRRSFAATIGIDYRFGK